MGLSAANRKGAQLFPLRNLLMQNNKLMKLVNLMVDLKISI